MIDDQDPRRRRPVTIHWDKRGRIGSLLINGEHWGAVEWSAKRNAWCVEDAEGQCLTHEAHIRGQVAAKPAAIALAKAMISDGRLPSPQEARQLLKHAPAVRIMSIPSFVLGVADVRGRRGFHRDYDLWDAPMQTAYERGRQWAALAPRDVPLKLNGQINPSAAALYTRHSEDIR